MDSKENKAERLAGDGTSHDEACNQNPSSVDYTVAVNQENQVTSSDISPPYDGGCPIDMFYMYRSY